MIPDNQMVVVLRDSSKKNEYWARLPTKHFSEQTQLRSAQIIVDHFKEAPDFDYDPMVHSPGKALIVMKDTSQSNPSYGLVTHAPRRDNKKYYFIGYVARYSGSSHFVAKYIFPWKFMDLFIKAVQPYFPDTDFNVFKRQLEAEYQIRQLPETDAEAIMNL